MRQAPRPLTVAAALLAGAALVGCGVAAEPPVTIVSPPEPLASQASAPAAEPAVARPLAPPRAMPEPPAPTAHYAPPEAADAPTPSPTSSPSPTPSAPSTSPSPAPAPTRLVALLPAASALAPLSWSDGAQMRSARWTEVAAAATVARGNALPHVAAARWAGGACASAADAVDGRAVEAAIVSLAADPASGSPIDLVLVRYPSASAAGAAVAAVQALGAACEGVGTPDGTLGSATPLLSATAVLTGDAATLRADVTGEGAMLIAVVHEGAPPEAIAALVAAQLAKLG